MGTTVTQAAAIVSLLTNQEISRNQIGAVIGISRQTAHRNKDRELSEEELSKIEEYFNVYVPRNYEIVESSDSDNNLNGRFVTIPYWKHENCNDEKIQDSLVNNLVLDLELIINKLGCNPDDLRIISMPGEEMDGGFYPLKNGDILLIDTSQTDIGTSGVYFITTQNHKMVFVRRLLALMYGELSSSVDNPVYAPQVNKTFSPEELKEIEFKVIGRVIKNMRLKM
jgi:hypothetical protein